MKPYHHQRHFIHWIRRNTSVFSFLHLLFPSSLPFLSNLFLFLSSLFPSSFFSSLPGSLKERSCGHTMVDTLGWRKVPSNACWHLDLELCNLLNIVDSLIFCMCSKLGFQIWVCYAPQIILCVSWCVCVCGSVCVSRPTNTVAGTQEKLSIQIIIGNSAFIKWTKRGS